MFKRDQKGGLVNDVGCTVEKWARQWLDVYKASISYKSRDNYRYIIASKIIPAIGDMRICDVRNVHLQGILNSQAGLSQSQISKTYITIKQIFREARLNHMIINDPAESLTRPIGSRGTHRALDQWEVNLVARYAGEHRAGSCALLMLFCGLRRSEALALTWQDVDFIGEKLTVHASAHFEGNKAIVVDRTKSPAGLRTIPIPAPLLAVLKRENEEKSGDAIFICEDAGGGIKPLSSTAYKRGWDGLLLALTRAANDMPTECTPGKQTPDFERIVRFTPHDLRHTYATMLYDAGVDVKSAQYFLGHADITTTLKIYTHLSERRKESATEDILKFTKQWE